MRVAHRALMEAELAHQGRDTLSVRGLPSGSVQGKCEQSEEQPCSISGTILRVFGLVPILSRRRADDALEMAAEVTLVGKAQ